MIGLTSCGLRKYLREVNDQRLTSPFTEEALRGKPSRGGRAGRRREKSPTEKVERGGGE